MGLSFWWRVPIAGELTRSRGDPCRSGQCRGHRAVVDSCIALFWLKGLIAGAGLFEEHGTRTSDLHRPGCDAEHYKNVGACVEVLFLLCTCCLTVHLRAMVVPHCRLIVVPRLVVAWVVKYSRRRLTARVSFPTENMAALVTRLRSGGSLAGLMESINSSSPSGEVDVEHTRRRQLVPS